MMVASKSCLPVISHSPSRVPQSGVVGSSSERLAVLVGPEAVPLQQDGDGRVAVPAAHQVVQRDARGVLRPDHVEDLVLHVLEVHRLRAVGYHLLLDGLQGIFKQIKYISVLRKAH
jgi:hypothetical protein